MSGKCLVQDQGTMLPASASTGTIRSGGKLNNHEPTMPPNLCVGRNKETFLHVIGT